MSTLTYRRVLPAIFLILITAALVWAALRVLFPAPPANVPVGVGFKGGTYEIFFARYKTFLARHQVTLEFRATSGAIENQKLLEDANSDIQIAFVQGGLRNSAEAPELVSLGRVAYQPFYIFYRADQTIADLTGLKGKRIAIGAPGNGSAVVAAKILAAAGVTAQNSTFLHPFSQAAVNALIENKADAMVEAFSNEEVVRRALRDPRIKMLSIRGADALVRLFPYLSTVVMPQGGVDYEHNIPSADVTMISTTVGILARNTLHPAVMTLLAEALVETHRHAGLLQRVGEFPTHSDPEFPMAPAAADYYRNGPSLLNRYVPFWITNSAQRLLAVLIAVVGVVMPLAHYLPKIHEWLVRRRLQAFYDELQAIEAEAALDARRREGLLAQLQDLEDRICTARLPSSFAAQRYGLRSHINMVRQKLKPIAA